MALIGIKANIVYSEQITNADTRTSAFNLRADFTELKADSTLDASKDRTTSDETKKHRGVCFDMRDKGECRRGSKCRFSHDAEKIKERDRLVQELLVHVKNKRVLNLAPFNIEGSQSMRCTSIGVSSRACRTHVCIGCEEIAVYMRRIPDDCSRHSCVSSFVSRPCAEGAHTIGIGIETRVSRISHSSINLYSFI